MRDPFKELQLSHLNFGKEQTIHADCAGRERQLLPMELISWQLFRGTSCPPSTGTHVWPQGRAPGEGNRLGQNAALHQPHQRQPASLRGVQGTPGHRCSHPLTKRALWEAGGQAAAAPSTPAQSLRETPRDHRAWSQTRHLRAILLPAWPSPQRKMLFSTKIHN